MLPPPYNTNYGLVPQSYTGMEQAGYPPGANAWPNVSPYMGPAVDQTTYENGNWFNRQLFGNRKYYFSTEALIGKTQRGSNIRIGAYGVNEIPATPGVFIVDHNQLFLETVAAVDNMPNRIVTATGGGGGGGAGTGDLPVFTERTSHHLKDPAQAPGVRGTWGWFNPDQSGFQVSAFGLKNSGSSYFQGTGLPYDETDAAFYTDYNENRLRALTGLPLQGADSDGDLRPGFVMPFDIFYRLRFESQLAGANVDWYWSSIYEKSSVMIRPVGGARLVQLHERFTFDGSDSGLGYTIQGARLQAGGGGGAVLGQAVGSPLTFEGEFSLPDVMDSHLSSQSRSLIAGPEAGLRFDIGGDRFKIWTQSKLGLLANHTHRTLQGFNIGDAYYVANGRTTTVMPRNDQAATSFYREDSSVWLSPMFEQSIFFKSHLLEHIPVLNKARFLNQAEFQAGYTLMVIGQVARPVRQIDWQAYVDDTHRGPNLKTDRSTFTNGTLSLGVEWAY